MKKDKILLGCFFIAVAVQSAPIQDDASFVQDTIKAIHNAQEPLVEMKSIEKTEIGKMEDAEKIEKGMQIKSSQDTATALGQVEQDASQTVKMEDKQQELALTSLTVAKNTVDHLATIISIPLVNPTIKQAEQTALEKLKTVRDTLSQSTATSNTQKKAAKIADEAKSLAANLVPNKDLGESLDAAPELNPLNVQEPVAKAADPEQAAAAKAAYQEQAAPAKTEQAQPAAGASSVLEQAAAKAQAAEPEQAKSGFREQDFANEQAQNPTPAAAAPEGAASSLQQALAKAKTNEDTLTKEEMTNQLDKMERQEKQVIGAENVDIAEVTKLANDLN